MSKQAEQAYKIINETAGSNIFIQGLTGIFGFPFTVAADGMVIFTHYGKMLNRIRALYNRELVNEGLVKSLVVGMAQEILVDVAADKVAGSVPIVGIYFNVISAKTMTWRLGIVFTMLAARGEAIDTKTVTDVTKLVRQVFPQNDMFKFKQPSYPVFEKLVNSVEDNSMDEFNDKVKKALRAFDE